MNASDTPACSSTATQSELSVHRQYRLLAEGDNDAARRGPCHQALAAASGLVDRAVSMTLRFVYAQQLKSCICWANDTVIGQG